MEAIILSYNTNNLNLSIPIIFYNINLSTVNIHTIGIIFLMKKIFIQIIFSTVLKDIFDVTFLREPEYDHDIASQLPIALAQLEIFQGEDSKFITHKMFI